MTQTASHFSRDGWNVEAVPLGASVASPTLPEGADRRQTSRFLRIMFALNRREQGLLFDAATRNRLAKIPTQSSWLEDASLEGARWRQALEAGQPNLLVTSWSTPPLPADWLEQDDCPLRYVCHVTGSVREIVPRSFLERGGKVTNWGKLAGREVAEHALLLALAALRRMPRWRGLQVEAGGEPGSVLLETRTLFGRRVGLHGFGSVAQSLLHLLEPFGVSVSAYSRGVPAAVMLAKGVEPCRSLEELFSGSEVLFECEALTEETRQSVGERAFAALPAGAVFVNVGRGQVVNEPALFKEASSGRIHVALDVTSEEPPPADPPLGRLPNVVMSPHLAGPTFESLPACGVMTLQNIRRFLGGEKLEAEVNLEIYDRST